MSFLATAGASLLGSIISGNAAMSGAQTQASAQRYAADLQHQQYEENKSLLNPYVTSGTNADSLYSNLVGVNGQAAQSTALQGMATSPFMSAIQQNANNQTLAAAGKSGAGISGNALNALYSQNANLYDNYLNQQIGYVNNEANRGLGAAQSLATSGNQAALNQGNFISSAGQSLGSGIFGQGNALGNAVNNIGLYGSMGGNNSASSQLNGWLTNAYNSVAPDGGWTTFTLST